MSEEQLRTGKIRVMKLGDMQKCPHFITMPEHYRPDGSCFCNDPNAKMMQEWGYKWDAKTKRWESTDG